jgi:hypothetical protein
MPVSVSTWDWSTDGLDEPTFKSSLWLEISQEIGDTQVALNSQGEVFPPSPAPDTRGFGVSWFGTSPLSPAASATHGLL